MGPVRASELQPHAELPPHAEPWNCVRVRTTCRAQPHAEGCGWARLWFELHAVSGRGCGGSEVVAEASVTLISVYPKPQILWFAKLLSNLAYNFARSAKLQNLWFCTFALFRTFCAKHKIAKSVILHCKTSQNPEKSGNRSNFSRQRKIAKSVILPYNHSIIYILRSKMAKSVILHFS